jgi:hypothetical protein
MKKLALAFIATASLAAPAFACPNSDHDSAQATATAKKDDKAPAKADAKAKPADAPKADTAKAAPAKDSKDTQKKPDKVSSK